MITLGRRSAGHRRSPKRSNLQQTAFVLGKLSICRRSNSTRRNSGRYSSTEDSSKSLRSKCNHMLALAAAGTGAGAATQKERRARVKDFRVIGKFRAFR